MAMLDVRLNSLEINGVEREFLGKHRLALCLLFCKLVMQFLLTVDAIVYILKSVVSNCLL
jgi:hypothetical protein